MGSLGDPLTSSYMLIDAQFNVYGIPEKPLGTPTASVGWVVVCAQQKNVLTFLQEMQSAKFVAFSTTDSCPAEPTDYFQSTTMEGQLSPRFTDLQAAVSIFQMRDIPSYCISALQVRVTGVLGKGGCVAH